MLTIGLYGVDDPDNQGISHDHGVAVMRSGQVVFCQELERHTRKKHDGSLSAHLEDLVGSALHNSESVQFVLANSFVGHDLNSSTGMIEIRGCANLQVPDLLAECNGKLSDPQSGELLSARFYTLCHEMAHLGTCLPFFGPFKENSLLIHIDGGASRSCASAWFYDGKSITCLDHGWHPGLKGAVNNFNASQLSLWILGMRESDHLSMPGKLMGLASFECPDTIATDWLKKRGWLRNEQCSSHEVLDTLQQALPHLRVAELSTRDRGCQVLAACMQSQLELEVLHFIRGFQEVTNARHLYYSGGAALNIHANSRIEQELGFDSVCIPPAPSDAGLALGAAAYLEWRRGAQVRVHSVFLNHLLSGQDQVMMFPDLPILHTATEAAQVIADGQILGVWTGNAELGPRALGHRSILARPDSVSVRVRVSESMKQREWYRPVSPMLLEEVACEALCDYSPCSNLANFMLGAWIVKPDWVEPLRGCVHTDRTVRAQVVRKGIGQLSHIHQLLLRLRNKYGIQGVINTSFNTRGEPIVHSLSEAVHAAQVMGLDALWLPICDK